MGGWTVRRFAEWFVGGTIALLAAVMLAGGMMGLWMAMGWAVIPVVAFGVVFLFCLLVVLT
jgi:hypothetical protein